MEPSVARTSHSAVAGFTSRRMSASSSFPAKVRGPKIGFSRRAVSPSAPFTEPSKKSPPGSSAPSFPAGTVAASAGANGEYTTHAISAPGTVRLRLRIFTGDSASEPIGPAMRMPLRSTTPGGTSSLVVSVKVARTRLARSMRIGEPAAGAIVSPVPSWTFP